MSALSTRRPLAQAAVAVLTACTATALTVLPAAAHVNDASDPVPAVGAFGPAAHGALLPASHASVPRLAVAQGADAYLPVRYDCSTNLRIKAQRLTSQQLRNTCASLLGQDTYFHKVVKDGGNPVAGDKNTSLEVIVFDSKSEYQRLGGYYYGANTESGGEYKEGDPSASGNQARFITYRDGSAQSFTIKNLNHEYT
ncbi:collagenase, partial [Streptomyces sp. S1]|uniref:collagenase n=1 Tax=Streptomyces sp. S1 TaxID=718288 RepID=UPI00196A0A71